MYVVATAPPASYVDHPMSGKQLGCDGANEDDTGNGGRRPSQRLYHPSASMTPDELRGAAAAAGPEDDGTGGSGGIEGLLFGDDVDVVDADMVDRLLYDLDVVFTAGFPVAVGQQSQRGDASTSTGGGISGGDVTTAAFGGDEHVVGLTGSSVSGGLEMSFEHQIQQQHDADTLAQFDFASSSLTGMKDV